MLGSATPETGVAAALSAPDHKYHDLFKLEQSKVSGVCRYCANAFGVAPQIDQARNNGLLKLRPAKAFIPRAARSGRTLAVEPQGRC